MQVKELVRRKPMDLIAAVALIALGILVSIFAKEEWVQGAGSALAAFGGAFLSYTAAIINTRSKALDRLRPELESMTRHLGDNVTRLNRNILEYRKEEIEAETALDRIGQLTTPFFGTVNELQLLVGAKPNIESIVDTMISFSDVQKRIDSLTARESDSSEADGRELEALRAERDSLRMQLASAKRDLGAGQIAKVDEDVECPACRNKAVVKLGRMAGDSAMLTCPVCAQRFHVHRGAQGKVVTRSWGGSSVDARREVPCLICGETVPVNFHQGVDHEDRYCLHCASVLLRIGRDGSVLKIRDAIPVKAAAVKVWGGRAVLQCPEDLTETIAIWFRDGVSRAVCKACGALLEAGRDKGGEGPTAHE